MKKSILFALIIALVTILCSCNMDAQDGIYSAIASSTKESNIKVKSYLGCYDNCYYVLTDSGVVRYGNGSNNFKNITLDNDIIVEAALLDDGSILIHTHNGGAIKKYDSDGTYVPTADFDGFKTTRLMTNGMMLGTLGEETGIYGSNCSLVETVSNVRTILESGDYTLIETTDGQIKIYDSKSTTPAAISAGKVGALSGYVTIGFEALDSTHFYILKDNAKVYAIEGATFDSITEFATIKYTLASGPNYSFHYAKDGVNYLVFKVSENFVEINLTDKTVETKTTGYGSIRQNEVVNIRPLEAEAGKFIVATFSNYVWKIDPTSTEDPVNIL